MSKKSGNICRRKLRGVPASERPAYTRARALKNAANTAKRQHETLVEWVRAAHRSVIAG
jgi:hypothetical protein